MNRRSFLKMTGLKTTAGVTFLSLPRLGRGEDGAADGRAKRLAELMDEQRLFARGARKVYRGPELTGISLPVGGIAAGPVQINGEARRHIWQIFRNYPAASLPDSFFAVRARVGESAPVVRVMQTVAEGPFAPMKALSFSGEYPFGWYSFEDPELPVKVSMEVFSPLIPLNTRDSGIPCGVFRLTVENPGSVPAEVSFLATQQNPVGYRNGTVLSGHRGATYGGNTNKVIHDDGCVVVHMNSTRANDDPTYGDLALATPAPGATATARWESLDGLREQFSRDGACKEEPEAGPTPAGETVDAAIAVPMVVPPGEKRTVTFVLAWHFANTAFMADKLHKGNWYANWWPDALSVARDVTKRLDSLTAQTRMFHETFYKSNLPHWLLDRISSQVAILSSMTCHWAKDGFFYAYEGCNVAGGCCDGNATHVWGYPQAHARLFPEIARRMREETYAAMKPDGMITVRFSHPFPAFDGMCHEVTATLREHQTSADPSWLERQWPSVKKAMDFIIKRWDADEDGMLAGPQHAMDGDQGGTSSWLGGTYLCALAAAATMARLQGDAAAAARYQRILDAGRTNQDKALFNGEYFVQVPDATPRQDYLTGCYIDQMLGQWWALQLDLGWLYPREHVRAAMESLFRYNFRTDFHGFRQAPRRFCEDGAAGLLQGTWPRGGRPKPPHVIQYTEEVMSGFEYTAACLMVQCGLMREGFAVLRAAADRYDGRLRQLPGQRDYASWGYSGNPFGDDECGKFYARAMAIWGVLVACQGFKHDATTGVIGFAPLWQPADHVSFFTAAEAWGTYSQQQVDSRLDARIEVTCGRLSLRVMELAPRPGATPTAARVVIGDRELPVQLHVEGGRAILRFPEAAVVDAGQALSVSLSSP